MTKTMRWMMLAAVVAFLVSAPFAARADVLTLADQNSIVNIDPDSSMGMYNWIIDDNDIMYQQWFWYRVGDTGPEESINTLTLDGTVVTDTDLDPGDDNAFMQYSRTDVFTIGVNFALSGGQPGSMTSDIAETITIHNTSRVPLDFHFFQYADLDLCGVGCNTDTVSFPNVNKVAQVGTVGGTVGVVQETSEIPDPSYHEGGYYPDTLNSLNDGSATTLGGGAVGPGDVTWAFQWDTTIAVDGSYIISKDKHFAQLVPEPASLLVLGTVLFFIGRKFRVRRP